MGNIADGTFSFLDTAKPCLASKCICTVPANRNMIEFDSNSGMKNILEEYKDSLLDNGFETVKYACKVIGKILNN
jgi:hypothetical protein